MTVGLASPARAEEGEGASAAVWRAIARVPSLAWPILILILIPTAVFVGADAVGGHLLLSGDNLNQSYPLHVLVGTDFRQGVVPSWDPWIWSGTPLLAGLNAGAFYPTTFLFAVINPHAAWVIGEIFIFSAVAVGTFVFFVDLGISRFAAFLGAAVFAFGGAVATQASIHTDMAEGLASLPWVMLAIRRIGTDGRWRWSVLLGVAFGLTILAGAPEAMLDIAVLGVLFGLIRISVEPGTWTRLVSRGAVAGLLAIGLTAALWLPALHFIDTSQRSLATMGFDAGFAFPSSALLLGVAPYLEGGLGMLSQPAYFGRSNLGEVSFYLGILPIVALISMWAPPWRDRLPKGEQRCWYTVAIVGVVLALASGTPLEHVVFHIPFYGKQRDGGRNIVDVDFAASVLFAWWVDGGVRQGADRLRTPAKAAFAPLALVVIVGTWFAVSPSSWLIALRAHEPPPSWRAGIAAGIGLAAALAAIGGLIAWARPRLTRKAWLTVVGGFAALDLALFACGSSYVGSQPLPTGPSGGKLTALVKANLSTAGRYAVYDPSLFDPAGLTVAGQPNLGILDGLKSFSGYGAIDDATYASETGSHIRTGFNVDVLQQGEFGLLGAQVIVTLPEEFLVPIANSVSTNGNVTPIAEAASTDPVLPGGSFTDTLLPLDPLTPLSPYRAAIPAGHQLGWFFGIPLVLGTAMLTLSEPARGQLVRAGTLTASGAIDWRPARRVGRGGHTATLTVAPNSTAIGLVVRVVRGPPLGPEQLVIRSDGRPYLVAGPLAHAITPPGWVDVGGAYGFDVFRDETAPQAAWVQPPSIVLDVHGRPVSMSSTSLVAAGDVLTRHLEFGSARVAASTANSATIDVESPHAGLLVWSTAWNDGWSAQVTTDGTTRSARITRVGPILAVAVPKGASVVRFSYEPTRFALGVALSLASLAALLVAIGWLVFARLRRRRAMSSGSA